MKKIILTLMILMILPTAYAQCQNFNDNGLCIDNCQGTNYLNSCDTLIQDDCRHCGFDCGSDYQCLETLDTCGMGSTGACIKLDGSKILMKRSNQIISTETNQELTLEGGSVLVAGVVQLHTLPQVIYDKVTDAGYQIQNIELRADDMAYLVDVTKDVKFLGLFSKSMVAEIEVSSLPDSKLQVDGPWRGFLAW